MLSHILAAGAPASMLCEHRPPDLVRCRRCQALSAGRWTFECAMEVVSRRQPARWRRPRRSVFSGRARHITSKRVSILLVCHKRHRHVI